jgi:hypothetical protein
MGARTVELFSVKGGIGAQAQPAQIAASFRPQPRQREPPATTGVVPVPAVALFAVRTWSSRVHRSSGRPNRRFSASSCANTASLSSGTASLTRPKGRTSTDTRSAIFSKASSVRVISRFEGRLDREDRTVRSDSRSSSSNLRISSRSQPRSVQRATAATAIVEPFTGTCTERLRGDSMVGISAVS